MCSVFWLETWRRSTGRNVRAAAQVRVVDGVAEVDAELNALRGQRPEHILADGARQHRQGVCKIPPPPEDQPPFHGGVIVGLTHS